ncbi:MAG TPA: RNA polymerase subunit sigma [Firmicutes bacterium]|nr:RNA polymerase subunit sigma [Bacillota bacterium]
MEYVNPTRHQDKNKMIQDHIPFIIKTVSDVTGRYVTLEHDEMSIGLLAFNEAIDKYDETKGAFLAFAKLVIKSRVLTYLKGDKISFKESSLDELSEAGIEFADTRTYTQQDLVHEIESLKHQILQFGFNLEELADDCPKHKDTRIKGITLSKEISLNESILFKMYEKLRLPIKLISVEFVVSEKFLKGSKKFIITATIIFDKKYGSLLQWLEGSGADV